MVLILVLMEDTLRVYNFDATEDYRAVLILVLMEDTLRALALNWKARTVSRLNPCFNGRYSQRQCRLIRRNEKN